MFKTDIPNKIIKSIILSTNMSVPIIFEYDYNFNPEGDSAPDIFDEIFREEIVGGWDLNENDDGKVTVDFSSNRDIDWFLSKIRETPDKFPMMYATLNYADEYDGSVVRYRDYGTKRVQCSYCRDLGLATIHKGEIFPCCEDCLCVCSEITHKGDDALPENMKIINHGGTTFRVCKDCVETFTRMESE
ncbi:MAG: hypothetical protein PHG66_04840 [Candidatus Colwellbacteria bacterium]|nr:hypothetical protein [Candidatus Colwellbacteria bacterium]